MNAFLLADSQRQFLEARGMEDTEVGGEDDVIGGLVGIEASQF